jgi:hypothetical protein
MEKTMIKKFHKLFKAELKRVNNFFLKKYEQLENEFDVMSFKFMTRPSVNRTYKSHGQE